MAVAVTTTTTTVTTKETVSKSLAQKMVDDLKRDQQKRHEIIEIQEASRMSVRNPEYVVSEQDVVIVNRVDDASPIKPYLNTAQLASKDHTVVREVIR